MSVTTFPRLWSFSLTAREPITARNLASRFRTAAGSGQVLVTDRFYRSLCHVVDAEPLGPRRLKGFDVTVNVYSLRALKGGAP
ncbi:MAG TPA: hypothetical protein VFW70_11290 [Methylomirabilota bacterium]|nr:hypothetical protein [Methylomirabilota bacterium]